MLRDGDEDAWGRVSRLVFGNDSAAVDVVDQRREESSLKQFRKAGNLGDDFAETLTSSGKLRVRGERQSSLKQVFMMVVADAELQQIIGGHDVIEIVRDIPVCKQGCQLSLPLH